MAAYKIIVTDLEFESKVDIYFRFLFLWWIRDTEYFYEDEEETSHKVLTLEFVDEIIGYYNIPKERVKWKNRQALVR